MSKLLSEVDLAEIIRRSMDATPGPWVSVIEGRDQTSGSSFIERGAEGCWEEDLYLTGASVSDYDFIAHARQDVPRLVDEVRILRKMLAEVDPDFESKM